MAIQLTENNFKQLAAQFKCVKQQILSMEQPEDFKDRVYHKYYQIVIQQLDYIFNNKFETTTTILDLQQFFLNNAKYIKVNLLTPTAIPQAETTLFLCSLAPFVCDDKKPIQILFGDDIQWESLNENYPNLDENIPLELIIKTHIISDDGSYLIPVRCLSEDLILEDYYQPKNAIYKHYSVYDKEYRELSRNEIARLIEHSKVTEELNAAVELHHKLVNEKSNDLYSNLDRLCRLLRIQDAYGGRGVQEHTGEGTFIALTQFIEYYDKLSSESKNQIPYSVKNAIDHLLNVSSDYKGHMASRVETCSADRRSELVNAMKGHEKALSAITISGDKTNQQKIQALATKEKHLSDLIQSLSNGNYSNGSDKLGFNRDLLEKLHLTFHIKNPKDLEYFKKLNPDEIRNILDANYELQGEIVNTIGSLENLIMLTHEMSRAGLTAFIEAMGVSLQNQFVENEADFYALIMTHTDNDTMLILINAFYRENYSLRNDLLNKEQQELFIDMLFYKLKYLHNCDPMQLQIILTNDPIKLNETILLLTASKTFYIRFTTIFDLETIKIIESLIHSYHTYAMISYVNDFYDLLKIHNDPDKLEYFIRKYDRNIFDYKNELLTEQQAAILRKNRFRKLEFLNELSLEDYRSNILLNLQVKNELAIAINSPSNFLAYTLELSVDKLEAFLNGYAHTIKYILIKNPIDLFKLLQAHDDEQTIKILCEWYGYTQVLDSMYAWNKHKNISNEEDFSVEKYQLLFSLYFKSINCSESISSHTNILKHVIQSKLGINALVALVNLGVDLEYKDAFGNTALLQALSRGKPKEYIQLLLNKGAFPYAIDMNGNGALDYCTERSELIKDFIEPCILNKDSFNQLFQSQKYNSDPLYQYKLALKQPIENATDHDIDVKRFLTLINFDETLVALLKTKRNYDYETFHNTWFKVYPHKQEALNELLKELLELRNDVFSQSGEFNAKKQGEFTINCLNALERARPQLESFHLTRTIIAKFILCLLIVPMFFLYLFGQLSFKPNSVLQIEKLEDKLLRHGYFKPPPPTMAAADEHTIQQEPIK